jgi:circadian clock protein KaiC
MKHFVDGVKRGDIRVVWQSSVEANVDRVGSDLLAAFTEHKPARIFIDSMQGFQVTSDAPERIEDFFAALTDHFISQGATMVFSLETEDILGNSTIKVPFSNASRMCRNILLMRFAEARGCLRRVFSVIKMRDSAFDSSVREMIIGDNGVEVGEPIVDLDMMLGGQPRRAE